MVTSLLFKQAVDRAEEEMQTSVWSILYSWSVFSKEPVCVAAKAGGLLSADAAQRISEGIVLMFLLLPL